MIKTCVICNKEFNTTKTHGGQNRVFCYECMPQGLSKRDSLILRRELLIEKASKEKLEIGCQICGYNKCVKALEWHHPDDDKEIDPSKALFHRCNWELYKTETNKCILLCANCHREVHASIV